MKAARTPYRLARIALLAETAKALASPTALVVAMLRQLAIEASRTADLMEREAKGGQA